MPKSTLFDSRIKKYAYYEAEEIYREIGTSKDGLTGGTRDEDVMQALQRKDDVQNWVMESLKARIRRIKDGN